MSDNDYNKGQKTFAGVMWKKCWQSVPSMMLVSMMMYDKLQTCTDTNAVPPRHTEVLDYGKDNDGENTVFVFSLISMIIFGMCSVVCIITH